MLEFLSSNWQTLVVGGILFLMVALVIVKLVRDKRRGKSSCSCGCESCANAEFCHGRKK